MRRFFHLLMISLVLTLPLAAFAVTDKEMEEARVIATKAYLRYANDGSGYLDDINPKTMEELEKALKTKEKENIKAFKAIKNPADYHSWDKDKLIEFWSVTAYQTKGLIEKGKLGKTRTKKLIGNMKLEDPSKAKVEEKPQQPVPTPAEQPATEQPTATITPDNVITETPDSSADSYSDAIQPQISQDEDFDEIEVKKVNNYTWVYILVLSILVAVVLALVVFAANVMKRNGANGGSSQKGDFNDGHGEAAQLKEQYSELISEKEQEVKMLTRKLENALRQNSELKAKLESLTTQMAALRNDKHPAGQDATQPLVKKPISATDEKEKTSQHQSASHIRTIYLGRANSKGIFIRADRNLNPGNSIYRLDTTDGYSGTFRIASDPSVWRTALKNPEEMLGYACNGSELDDTEGFTRIITESAGTAVFEGGCWRVIRKARIRYE